MRNILANILIFMIACITVQANSGFSSERLAESVHSYIQSQKGDRFDIQIVTNINAQNFNQSDVRARFSGAEHLRNGLNTIKIEFFTTAGTLSTLNIQVRANDKHAEQEKAQSSEIVIRRGENVRIVVVSGSVQVSATGTALQDAAVGDLIRVRRNGTRSKILQGTAGADGNVYLSSNRLSSQ